MLYEEEKFLFHHKNSLALKNKSLKTYLNYIIKYIFIIFFLLLRLLRKETKIIEIDNEICQYENNSDFSNYSTDIKTVVLYLPQFHVIKENEKWWGKGFTEWTNVKKALPLYKGHHQPRIPGDKLGYLGYYDLTNFVIIKKQVELAKKHGIYGFGIYYYWFSGKRLLEKPLDILLNHKEINFKFLLIWANENWTKRWDGKEKDILIKQRYKENDPILFINDIKKYLLDSRYIKYEQKPIIGIYEPMKILNLKKTIAIWREYAKNSNIGEIYIIVSLNQYNISDIENLNLFDSAYEFPPRDSLGFRIKHIPYYLYTATLYKEQELFNVKSNFTIYRGSMLSFDNSPRKKNSAIFEKYSPEQFYMLNKKIIAWTKEKYDKNNRFIFINAWNEWGEGTYLEPDNKYGYASINALSKALFNISYRENYISFNNSKNNCIIAIQAHIFYEDLIKEIIDKANNIPEKFDLFISTDNIKKRDIINKNIIKYSKAHKYEIIVFQNKGRDILPFLLQMKNVIKNYKYICHIHSKKTKFMNFGDNWRKYLLNNLLGNKNIIYEILYDFETNEKLGFIFPETYYKVLLYYGDKLTILDRKQIKFLVRIFFPGYKIGERLEFPAGNMFWAKVKSIYGIFEKIMEREFPKELGQNDGTLMHGIERIWLYFVKFNGYYYKKIFKHF